MVDILLYMPSLSTLFILKSSVSPCVSSLRPLSLWPNKFQQNRKWKEEKVREWEIITSRVLPSVLLSPLLFPSQELSPPWPAFSSTDSPSFPHRKVAAPLRRCHHTALSPHHKAGSYCSLNNAPSLSLPNPWLTWSFTQAYTLMPLSPAGHPSSQPSSQSGSIDCRLQEARPTLVVLCRPSPSVPGLE